MPGIKELKTRIKSVQSTRKITKAMQMVSAAKMRKSQTAALSSRKYSDLAWDLINNISKTGAFVNPLVSTYPNAKKVGIILITSNKGLVGSLNSNLISSLKNIDPSIFNKNEKPVLITEIITYGKKGNQTMGLVRANVTADFPKQDRAINAEDIYPISKMIATMYMSGEYKKIYLVYSKFISTLSQKPEIKQLLPFNDSLRESIEGEQDELEVGDVEYLFEPTPKIVLEQLLPRIIESQIYEAVLESQASEHSARMVMMKNATEAAGDLISDYTLTYNQLRQGKITTELAEITAGRIALE